MKYNTSFHIDKHNAQRQAIVKKIRSLPSYPTLVNDTVPIYIDEGYVPHKELFNFLKCSPDVIIPSDGTIKGTRFKICGIDIVITRAMNCGFNGGVGFYRSNARNIEIVVGVSKMNDIITPL